MLGKGAFWERVGGLVVVLFFAGAVGVSLAGRGVGGSLAGVFSVGWGRCAGWLGCAGWCVRLSTVLPMLSSSVCECLWWLVVVLVWVCSFYAMCVFLLFLGDPLHFVPRRAIRYISPRGGEDTASIPIA